MAGAGGLAGESTGGLERGVIASDDSSGGVVSVAATSVAKSVAANCSSRHGTSWVTISSRRQCERHGSRCCCTVSANSCDCGPSRGNRWLRGRGCRHSSLWAIGRGVRGGHRCKPSRADINV